MNALTFGLLITALSGFAQGQSLTLIAAELVVMVVVGIFFIRRQSFLFPYRCYRWIYCVSRCFHFLFAHLFALSAHKCWQWFPCPFTCKPCSGVVKSKQVYF
ncbi:hypothetical protein ACLB1N_11175 [Escherichia coli]